MIGVREIGSQRKGGLGREGGAIDAFVGVGDVEEEVVLVMFLIDRAHGGGCGWDGVVHEEE